jgi:SAM-dependent methyltransferase
LSVKARRRGRALERVVERYMHIGPATRMLQIGLPREAELHHFRQGVRYGIEPLAGVLAARGLLRWGQVRWVAGRGEELPFPDGHFRLVLLGDVLDHVESPGRVLEEACRCLAPDGVLWLTCRTACRGWRAMLGRLLGRGELAAGVRTCNRAAAALLRQCRQARLRRLWSAWSDLESSDQTESPAAFSDHPPREPSNLELGARKQFLFHARRAGLRAEAAFEQRAATAA